AIEDRLAARNQIGRGVAHQSQIMVCAQAWVKNLLVDVSRGTSPARALGGHSHPPGHRIRCELRLPQHPHRAGPPVILEPEPRELVRRPAIGTLLRWLAYHQQSA